MSERTNIAWTDHTRNFWTGCTKVGPGCDGCYAEAFNRWICVETRAKRMGIYGKCETCGGEGEIWPSAEVKAASEAWAPTEPPRGDGWQMWETTSEGSPISPVFATPEELARWLADTGASSFGDCTESYETWLKMIRAGWAPSAVIVDGKMTSGVAAA